MSSSNIKIRIPYGELSAMGPGKADLLDAIESSGSISAAARNLGMSYKRAWDLVNTMNRCFSQPLVSTATGGSHGGGAQVTEFGQIVLRRYRALVVKAEKGVAADLQELATMLASSSAKK